ncbi:hypothetical protein D3C75_974260 [compost metagenome]
MEPRTTAKVARNTLPAPKIASPIITEASPITIMPIPIVESAKEEYWAISAPDSATIPLDRLIPRMVVVSVLTPKLRIIRALSPVARKASPRSVRRNRSIRILTAIITNGITSSGLIEVNKESSPMSETFGFTRIRRLME